MRNKLVFGALAVAAGFAAVPVLAQTTEQQTQPGMSMSAPSQPEQQAQRSGGCPCCQRMSMMHQQTPPAQPKP